VEALPTRQRSLLAFNRGKAHGRQEDSFIARLKQIINQRRGRNSEAEAQARAGDRFDAEAFGYGTEIKPEESTDSLKSQMSDEFELSPTRVDVVSRALYPKTLELENTFPANLK